MKTGKLKIAKNGEPPTRNGQKPSYSVESPLQKAKRDEMFFSQKWGFIEREFMGLWRILGHF